MVMLFDITSVEDGTVLHLSQINLTYNSNSYQARVQGVSGFEQMMESAPLGIMAIPDINLTLGDADGGMTTWDAAHVFKNAKITATLIFWNPTTKSAASSDSRVVFSGICHPLQESTPLTVTLSAYNRFNAQFCLIPADRISALSQTSFPTDGMQDSDDGNSSSPANSNSAGYAMLHGESSGGLPVIQATDIYKPYFPCGYGPLRGSSGWGGGNPLGNFLVASVLATASYCSSTAIGNSSASYPASNGLAGHIVVIVSGTGAGQIRRIASNTTSQITVANKFTTTPDGTSLFCVLYGNCGQDVASCQARGMYTTDTSGRNTFRNRSVNFVPTNVNYHSHPTSTNPNQAKYNQAIPLVYGTTMVPCLILFLQSSSSVTYGELLVCAGPISSLSQLIVGNVIVPYQSPSAYTFKNDATGHWTYRNGVLGNYFPDPYFNGPGVSTQGATPDTDILSQMAVIMLQVPNQFGDDSSMQAYAMVNGLWVQAYDQNGNASGTPSSSMNPAWILLDLLQRMGWQPSEINFPSFYAFSVYANQFIDIALTSATTTPSPRFTISPTVMQQGSAADALRGVLKACRGLLSFDQNGLLRIDCENRITDTEFQSPIAPGTQWAEVEDGAGITIGSVLTVGNGATQETVTVLNVQLDNTGYFFQFQAVFAHAHNGGEPIVAAYSYSFGPSSICQDSKGSPDLKRSSLKASDTPNQYLQAFIDSMRGYVSDSVTLSNAFEVNQFGATVVGNVGANGLQTVDAAVRLAQLDLYKAHGRRSSSNAIISRGNLFATLTSSVKALDVKIGSICQLTYSKENWTNKAFRVVQISPTQDSTFPYWKTKLVLREHDDGWYDDINGNIPPAIVRVPAWQLPPIVRTKAPPPIIRSGQLTQQTQQLADGNVAIAITVPFIPPQNPPIACTTSPPASLNLSTGISQLTTGGSLAGGHNYFYSFTALDSSGVETVASRSIEVVVPLGTNTNKVTLAGVRPFDSNAVNYKVYRAVDNPLSPLLIQGPTAIPAGGSFSFTDTGLSTSSQLPPSGEAYNIRAYWRLNGATLWALGTEVPILSEVNDPFSGSALSSNWIITEGGFSLSGGKVSISSVGADSRASAVYVGGFPDADQYTELAIASALGSGALGPAVRMSTSGETYYGFYCSSSTAYLFKAVSGTVTVISSTAHASNPGDVLAISVQGTSLIASVNGVALITASDSSITSGFPGIAGFDTNPTSNSGNYFSAGNISGSLTFDVPLSIGGQLIDIQLRSVSANGYETPQESAPIATYPVTSPSPLINSGAHSTYIPLTNPLTAVDAGSNASIDIAAFTMRVAGNDVAVSGGSITGLAYETLYYIYYSDPSYSGGAVSYQYSTSKFAATDGSSLFFVGSIVTPIHGGNSTVGNNDGGAGAQSGDQSGSGFSTPIVAVNDNGVVNNLVGGTGAFADLFNAVDGNPSTFTKFTFTGNGLSSNISGALILSPSGLISSRYSSATLSIKRALPVNSLTGGFSGSVAYSLIYSTSGPTGYMLNQDSPTSPWTTIESMLPASQGGTTIALSTITISLPQGLNLNNLAVQAMIGSGSNDVAGGSMELDLYDVSLTVVS